MAVDGDDRHFSLKMKTGRADRDPTIKPSTQALWLYKPQTLFLAQGPIVHCLVQSSEHSLKRRLIRDRKALQRWVFTFSFVITLLFPPGITDTAGPILGNAGVITSTVTTSQQLQLGVKFTF